MSKTLTTLGATLLAILHASIAHADVTATLSNGDLIISDAGQIPMANSIAISQVGEAIEIRGRQGTLVNNSASILVPFPTDDIIVTMTSQDSDVSFYHLDLYGYSDDIRVDVTGRVVLYYTFAFTNWHSDIVISRGDVWTYYCGVNRDFKLPAGRHELNSTSAGHILSMVGSNSTWRSLRDYLELNSVWTGQMMEIKLQGGDDELYMDGISGGLVVVDMAAGNDTLWLYNFTSDSEFFEGGSGSDTVYQNESIANQFTSQNIEYFKR